MAPLFTGLKLGFGRGESAATGLVYPQIGAPYQGGFFAGFISHTANSVATHALIVAPAATGASGTGYTITTNLQAKTTNNGTSGTDSDYDGAANSSNMNNASHPAAEFCENLSIGGYTDWYLPARYELEIAYYNLKPTTDSNNTSWYINPYSVPARGSNYTSGNPAQTTVTLFKTGNSEAFVAAGHWTSTQDYRLIYQWYSYFNDGLGGQDNKTEPGYRTRAFRKVAL
jgi:hypothetical protein